MKKTLPPFIFPLLLLISLILGSGAGSLLHEKAAALKPLGDLFLNLLFTAAVPLIFFSIASAIGRMEHLHRLSSMFGWMVFIFIATGLISSLLMIAGVRLFPPVIPVPAGLQAQPDAASIATAGFLQRFLEALAVSDFSLLLSKKNMPALILFSSLIGAAASMSGESGKSFVQWLVSGNAVMMKLVRLIMWYAPIGLFSYFAYLTGTWDADLMGGYFRAMLLYYPLTLFYFFAFYTFYVWLAGGRESVRLFWKHILTPAITAFGTSSSLATVPSNLEAADRIGIPRDVSRLVIPIGATVHMEGTCLAAILKIAVLFSITGQTFAGGPVFLMAVAIALISGIVMAGIPGGGFLGEMLIISMYGFPPELLPVISMVGTLVDPPATMVNATGDSVSSMLIARLVHGKKWRVHLHDK